MIIGARHCQTKIANFQTTATEPDIPEQSEQEFDKDVDVIDPGALEVLKYFTDYLLDPTTAFLQSERPQGYEFVADTVLDDGVKHLLKEWRKWWEYYEKARDLWDSVHDTGLVKYGNAHLEFHFGDPQALNNELNQGLKGPAAWYLPHEGVLSDYFTDFEGISSVDKFWYNIRGKTNAAISSTIGESVTGKGRSRKNIQEVNNPSLLAFLGYALHFPMYESLEHLRHIKSELLAKQFERMERAPDVDVTDQAHELQRILDKRHTDEFTVCLESFKFEQFTPLCVLKCEIRYITAMLMRAEIYLTLSVCQSMEPLVREEPVVPKIRNFLTKIKILRDLGIDVIGIQNCRWLCVAWRHIRQHGDDWMPQRESIDDMLGSRHLARLYYEKVNPQSAADDTCDDQNPEQEPCTIARPVGIKSACIGIFGSIREKLFWLSHVFSRSNSSASSSPVDRW